jgi:hypothetical protein
MPNMKNKFWLWFLPLLALMLFPAAVSALGVAPHLPGIVDLRGEIEDELNSIDGDLAQAARQLSTVGIYNGAAPLLLNIYNKHTSIVDVATVDPAGYLITIQPDRYKSAEGQRINEQPHFMEITKTGRPAMSGMFKTVEGFYAASIIYPVVNLKGQTIGYVSIVFKPDALMGNVIKQYNKSPVEAFALQTDGRVIYDKDIRQIGKMTFSDPAYQGYPDLLHLAAQITAEASGAGTYTYPVGSSGAPAKKATEWTTVFLHGVEWRLVVSKTL